MPLTITFEKKHFLIAGVIVAFVFAVSQIIAAVPSGQYHPISELWINSDIDMQNNKVIKIETPTASDDAATKGYVDAAGGGSGGDYFVSLNCECKSYCGGSVGPWVAPLSNCPVGCTEVYYAEGINGDNSVVGVDYQRFGNIIVRRQKTLYTISSAWRTCSTSKSLSAWDANYDREFKDTGSSSVGYNSCFGTAKCEVSCSIRVCSCS